MRSSDWNSDVCSTDLALACGLLVMSANAYLVSPVVGIGVIPDGGAAGFLNQRLGYARAFEVLTDGRKLSAEQCVAWGLANRAVEAAELDAHCLQWATQLAAKDRKSTRLNSSH